MSVRCGSRSPSGLAPIQPGVRVPLYSLGSLGLHRQFEEAFCGGFRSGEVGTELSWHSGIHSQGMKRDRLARNLRKSRVLA